MESAQRPAHQPPRARYTRWHQKRHDLAREAVGLHARVGLPQATPFTESVCTVKSEVYGTLDTKDQERAHTGALLLPFKPIGMGRTRLLGTCKEQRTN